MQSAADRQKGRKKKRDDLEEGELTLLNDLDDDIDRLDKDEDRPFQSFAISMQSFSKQKGHSDYTKLTGENPDTEAKRQLEQMQEDLTKIKDKERALDAENKILRAQLFSSTKSIERASDYQKLPGE